MQEPDNGAHTKSVQEHLGCCDTQRAYPSLRMEVAH